MDELVYRLLNIIDEKDSQIEKLLNIINNDPLKNYVESPDIVNNKPIQLRKSSNFYGVGGIADRLENKYTRISDEQHKKWEEEAKKSLQEMKDAANITGSSGGIGEGRDEFAEEEEKEA